MSQADHGWLSSFSESPPLFDDFVLGTEGQGEGGGLASFSRGQFFGIPVGVSNFGSIMMNARLAFFSCRGAAEFYCKRVGLQKALLDSS